MYAYCEIAQAMEYCINFRWLVADEVAIVALQTSQASPRADTEETDLEISISKAGVQPPRGSKYRLNILLVESFQVVPNVETLRLSRCDESDEGNLYKRN